MSDELTKLIQFVLCLIGRAFDAIRANARRVPCTLLFFTHYIHLVVYTGYGRVEIESC
jgi:hypothetical protein